MNPIVIRLLLGGLLLVAAGLKGHQLATEPVLESGLLHWRPLSVCVVEVEIAIGIWLLSGVYLLAARHVAILWFALLGCVSFWNLVAGVTDCHCFGKLSVEPKWVFLVDFAAVASLLWCRPRTTGSKDRPKESAIQLGATVAIALVAAVSAAMAVGVSAPSAVVEGTHIPASGNIILLSPQDWLGKRLPLLAHLEPSDPLARGRWLVLFYHHDCPKCQQAMRRYESLPAEKPSAGESPRAALVEMPPFGNPQQAAYPACLMVQLKPTNDWFMQTPCELEIRDGIVELVRKSFDSP